ncbi:RNA-dependent RNA polymerase [Ophiostoma mitovirus 7]|uniref:RNA-dependent RNA polymerase n=1 Tax=Ophiostoma mitovirus 7 TaxID=1387984 RepID=A0ABM5NPB4_9VIRU|nr:RNA-dependent RNA polymerase [Ophiostoma mitovirus 7]AGT55877.1 RNA-dependent RNA polymerase [Ophiostoma mitovirus 7]
MKFNSPNKDLSKFSHFNIYRTAILNLFTQLNYITNNKYKVSDNLLNNFFVELNYLTIYMLEDRFKKTEGKKKSSDNNINLSADLSKFLNVDKSSKADNKKQLEINLNDVIKFYKSLEQIVINPNFSSDIEDFSLGKFKNNAEVLHANLPILLLDIRKIENREEKELLQNILWSIISIYRQFKVKTKANLNTITDGYSGLDFYSLTAIDYSQAEITEWLNTLDFKDLKPKLYMYSGNASSPNSGPSAKNLLKDVAGVLNDSKLMNSIKSMSSYFQGGKELLDIINSVSLNIELDKEFCKDAIHSRLVHFTAPGGKSRLICVVDWLTQSVLSRIHYTLFDLLSKMESDFTFDHKSALNFYEDKYPEYISIDLSAATDRMPKYLQKQIIEAIFNKLNMNGTEIANNRYNILDRSYSTDKISKGTLSVKYTVGQGMGCFSSWPIMAIMHHYIVNHLCGIPMSEYRLIGDDLLLRIGGDFYKDYLKHMSNIGVSVNQDKTVISSRYDEHHTDHHVEIARTYIINGIRLNPIQWGTIFAFKDNKISFEALIYANKELFNISMTITLAKFFLISDNKQDWHLFLYFCFKLFNSSFFEYLDKLSKLQEIPKWVTPENFKRIQHITDNSKNELVNYLKINNKFTDTLKSQCVVRTEKELTAVHDLGNQFGILALGDDRIAITASMIRDRLLSAEVITYTGYSQGAPPVTKREKRLISDICKYHSISTCN